MLRHHQDKRTAHVKKSMFFIFIFLFGALPAMALERLRDHRDWAVFTHASNGDKMCFAVTKPKDMEPKNVKRGEVLFYITKWKNIKGDGEVSIKIGYPFSPNSKPEVAIGGQKFRLFVKGDKAWVSDEATEKKMIRAMRRGSTMLVTAVSRRGTQTRDRYSLSGITAAIRTASRACK